MEGSVTFAVVEVYLIHKNEDSALISLHLGSDSLPLPLFTYP